MDIARENADNQDFAYGIGVATIAASGEVLDVWYPVLGLGQLPADSTALIADAELSEFLLPDPVRNVSKREVVKQIQIQAAPADTADAYLRLHLISARLIKPHGANLDGIFGLLTNVAWTNAGPCSLVDFAHTARKLRAKYGTLTVYGVDKFPRMVDYVIPDGVRIADADRVRLGAYLASGTTIMHEGFVNFNAGTLGKSMVEGRISAGVVVGDGSDIGGGASIMGTLSGGGKQVISIGERSLLGANSGLGISLGDDCIVESGLYLTAGSKVELPDGRIVKALELSGASNLVFRRNSQSGAIQALAKSGQWEGLNSILHAND
jgi:2,3,4,5-tetrahydropyridine-2-carboxylate N-succinyltransferase